MKEDTASIDKEQMEINESLSENQIRHKLNFASQLNIEKYVISVNVELK